jgi:Uncharacterized conserved protein (DUF2340)
MSDVLTNTTLPKTSATITLRVIKSFEYRTEKSLVLHDINLEQTTVRGLKEQVLQREHAHFPLRERATIHLQVINTSPGWKPFRNVSFGVLQVVRHALHFP